MNLNELKEKIYEYLFVQDNPLKAELTGGLHYVENLNDPGDVSYPYGVYSFITGSIDRDSKDKWYDPILVIDLYDHKDQSSRPISAIGKKLRERIDEAEAQLTLTNYYVLSIDLTNTPVEERTTIQSWHHRQRYRIQLQTK